MEMSWTLLLIVLAALVGAFMLAARLGRSTAPENVKRLPSVPVARMSEVSAAASVRQMRALTPGQPAAQVPQQSVGSVFGDVMLVAAISSSMDQVRNDSVPDCRPDDSGGNYPPPDTYAPACESGGGSFD
jgi:hypothetical protein